MQELTREHNDKLFNKSVIALIKLSVCLNGWSTDKVAGGAADEVSIGISCSQSLPIATQCPNHINAACVMSFKTFSYKCCGDVLPGPKVAAVNGATMGGLDGTAKPSEYQCC